MSRRVLLTGGCGFIGSNFVRYVLGLGEDVHITNLDLLTYAGNRASLSDLEDDPRYDFVQGDIADPRWRSSSPVSMTSSGGESHVDRSIDNPGIFIRTNITGTQVLLEPPSVTGPSLLAGVYRRGLRVSGPDGLLHGVQPDSAVFALFSADRRRSPGAGIPAHIRLAGEHARCSNNYGPYQFPEKLIPLMIAKLAPTRRCRSMGMG